MTRINVKSTEDLKDKIATNPELQRSFMEDPVAAAGKLSIRRPLDYDVWIYRMVVSALGVTVVAIVVGIIVILAGNNGNMEDKAIPNILTAIGSAAIGALAGLLAPVPSSERS